MGMNFYVEYNRCSCCERHDVLHIGKSSFGWTFSFRGYDPERNDFNDVPEGICIKSEEDWRDFLNQEDILIKDEDGEIWSNDDFWEKVESKRDAKYNHTIECRNGGDEACSFEVRTWTREHGWKDCWIDEKGNSFSGTKFS